MKQYYAVEILCPPLMAEAMEFRMQARGSLGTAVQDPEAYRDFLQQGDATIFHDPDGFDHFGDLAQVMAWFAVRDGKICFYEPYRSALDVNPGMSFDESACPNQAYPPRTAETVFERDRLEILKIFNLEEEGESHFSWVQAKDWEEAWKTYFQVFDISDHITIRPSWLTAEARPDKQIITLDAGSAFGTGEHASTRIAARLIDGLLYGNDRHEPWSILDLGCGSGILAMIAAKLGRDDDKILAIDLDPRAAETAADNLRDNELGHIDVKAGELKDVPGPYDFLISNLILSLHLDLLEAYEGEVKPGGYLLVSGVTTERAPEWRAAIEDSKFTIEKELEDEEWTGWLLLRILR